MTVTTIYVRRERENGYRNSIPVASIEFKNGKYIATRNYEVIAESKTRHGAVAAAEQVLELDPHTTHYTIA